MNASRCCFVAGALLFISLMYPGSFIGTISNPQELNPAFASRVFGGDGGSCWATDFEFCEEGDGCSGYGCGSGAGPWTCPVAPTPFDEGTPQIKYDPGFLVPAEMYTFCAPTDGPGYTQCSFPPTPVDCGEIETCQTQCVGGAPLGSGFSDHTARCVSDQSSDITKQSHIATGTTCS